MKDNPLSKFKCVLSENGITIPEYIKSKTLFGEYPANCVICSAGDVVHGIQLLLSGELFISNIFCDGNEYVFANEKTLTFLGDIEYFSGNFIYAASVISKTNTVFMRFGFDLFNRWLEEDRALYTLVVRQMAVKCYKGTIKQGYIKYEDSTKRVTKMLLALAQPVKGRTDIYQAECSHYEIARMTGMSERTVARVLRKLQDNGHIKLKYKRIVIEADAANLL